MRKQRQKRYGLPILLHSCDHDANESVISQPECRSRLVARDHVTPTLKDRHWLPVEQRFVFKLCLLMHQLHTGRAPSYLHNCVSASADLTSRPRLRSTSCSRRYEPQRKRLKFGERSFSCAGPRAWNSLPSSLHDLTYTKTLNIN